MTARLGPIAHVERRLLARNGVAVTLVLSFAALAGLAISLGAARLSRYEADRALLTSPAQADAARGADYVANQRGTVAVLPPAPLLGLALGQSDVYPTHYRITARLSDAQLAGDQLEHPLALYAGPLDLTFVIIYLYPLLILGVSHDLVATDRARGTLGLMVAQGASVRTLAAGRVLVRLVLVLLLPVAAAVVAVATSGLPTGAIGRLSLWTLTATVYGLFWLGLAVHVNARGRSAATNALTLAGAWLTLVVVVPSLVNLAARSIYPVPSRVQLATTMREASRDAVAEGSRTLGRFLEDHPSSGTGEEGMRQFYMLQEVRDAKVADRVQGLLSAFEDQVNRQASLVSVLQFTSPAIVSQLALTDVAGTSGHRSRWFADQATSFQREWKASFPSDVLARTGPAPVPLPEFRFVEESLRVVVRRTALPLVVLGAAAAVLIGTGLRRFDRYSITGP